MLAKLKSSKCMSVIAVLAAAAIAVSYSLMSDNKVDNSVYYTETAIYILAGILFSIGMLFAYRGKRNTGIPIAGAAVLLPILAGSYLTADNRGVPYLFQAAMCAKNIMTMACPFLASALLKRLNSITEKRKHGTALMSIGYYIIAFAATALVQAVMKQMYSYWYGYDTTWNAAEALYWVITINAVYLHNTSMCAETSAKLKRSRNYIYALIANAAAACVLISQSSHIRSIIYDFITNLIHGSLGDAAWLAYRLDILKGITGGEFSVGVSTLLAEFPNEFPVCILWAAEPLASIRLTYGWLAVFAELVPIVAFIAALCIMSRSSRDEIGIWIKYSFTVMCCLSIVCQMFAPTYGLIMPLMGNGACMISMVIVYIAYVNAKTHMRGI